LLEEDWTIEICGLGKQYSYYDRNKPRTIMEAALSGWRNLKAKKHFWALQDIDLKVFAGEMLGIVGKNGAGKSTLLRLIGSVGRPDWGRVRVRGRIGALLDLGAGLHPDLTGRENVFVSGVVAGLLRREVAQNFADIVAFAEIAEFIDRPIRTYSTGMKMRLAFSAAIHTQPQVLWLERVRIIVDGNPTETLQRYLCRDRD
jgi:lipopolysaccharide transport system ATP-binding protein